MEVLHSAPTTSSLTPLSAHQSQTPESFFDGPPVLYHHSPSATLKTHASDLAAAPALSALAEGAHQHSNGTSTINGNAAGEEQDEEIEVQGVDIWVTSESVPPNLPLPEYTELIKSIRRLILFSPTQNTGISIPYPTISLHAIQSQPASLFLQLLTSAQTFDDHDPDSTISIILIPSRISTELPPTATEDGLSEPQSPAELLYAALSACANLHPDPLSGSEGEGEGEDGQNPAIRFEGDGDIGGVYPLSNSGADGGSTGLPPPMPGSGGWITAENVGDFFDEEGNWRGGEEFTESEVLGVPGAGLGVGAGSVREREDGEGEGEDETKWRRTG